MTVCGGDGNRNPQRKGALLTMTSVKPVTAIDELAPLKRQYMQQTTAPLDGMWLCGLVPLAAHYGIYEEDDLVGFYCVNDEGFLLQFFVTPDHQHRTSQLFASILRSDQASSCEIRGAFVSTAEPRFLSLCLDQFASFEVNALMYQHAGSAIEQPQSSLAMTAVDSAQLSQAVDFAVASIGAAADWLRTYFKNLIDRRELFGVWKNGQLIATGESRGYDEFQTGYADVGVIVARSERGKGVATKVLMQLVARNQADHLQSICSTERTNVAAQKAISRAGFFASNRIIQFHTEASGPADRE